MSNEQSSLGQFVSMVDANDAVSVSVTLLVGGASLSGHLISEVAYRESLTEIVRQSNTSAAAPAFHAFTEHAQAKREENARRNRVRPHSRPPEAPEYAHFLEEGTDGKVWCLPLALVQAWSVNDVSIGEDPGA